MRSMHISALLILGLGLAACGDDGGSTPATDAPTGSVDAPPAPLMVTISGTATEQSISGSMPVADATVGAYASSNEATPLAMTTTAADGTYSLTINTTGTGIAGYLKATKSGFKDTYLYPPSFIADDITGAPLNMVTPGTFDLLSTVAQGNQLETNGVIAVVVARGVVPNLMPIDGAAITTSPAATRYSYNGANGLPDANATVTHTDGVAYAFNIPPGPATVTASKTGASYATTSVKSFAGALTTTTVVQQ